MTVLPIVVRELRVAARQRHSYWVRFGTALTSILIGAWILLAMRHMPPQLTGKSLFSTLIVLCFFYSLTSGIRITSDCLSEEKREGTLGLLFLTDLKGYDVVLGKLAATSLNAFYGLLAFFPVLAVCLLMGGVAPGEFWRALLVGVNLLFFSLAVGIFASAICTAERKAMSATILILLALCFGPPLLGFALGDSVGMPYEAWIPSPIYNFRMATVDVTQNHPRHFWWCLTFTHLYAWGFFIAACVLIPHRWQEKASASAGAAPTGTPNSSARSARTQLLEINPFLWLAARGRMKSGFIWVALGAGGLLWLWFWSKSPRDWLDESNFVMTGFLAHFILKFWVASEACRRFAEDRRSGALELLLCTPLPVSQILRGQLLALARQFRGPVAAVLAVDFMFVALGSEHAHGSEARNLWMLTALSGMALFLLDLWALSWLSMWYGLAASKATRPAFASLWRILVLPWLIFGISMTAFALVSFGGGINLPSGTIPLFWFLIGAAVDLLYALSARRRLREQFRKMAAQKTETRRRGFLWFAKSRADGLEMHRVDAGTL